MAAKKNLLKHTILASKRHNLLGLIRGC